MPRKAPAKSADDRFLAASAALAARPAVAATPQPAPAATDVIIVGAGAAGIAAARRIAAAGRRYVLVEASDHIGGRCITDTKTFGVAYDRGAHWIYAPDLNPLTKLTPRRGVEVYPAPPSQKIRIGRRYAREGELEDFLAAEVRATRAINDAARKADVPCEQVMPNDLGDWRATVEFMLGPFGCGKELSQFSALDFSRAAERTTATFCRQGFGALLAALAEGVTVQLSTPVKSIDTRRSLAVETGEGHADRARRHRHRLDQHHCRGPHSILARTAAPCHRRLRPALARQLRPHRAGACRQSARPRQRRPGVREIRRQPHRRHARQCVRHAAVPGRRRRRVRPRSVRARRSRHGRFRHAMAGRALRRRDQESDRPHAKRRAGTPMPSRSAPRPPPCPAASWRAAS